MGEKVKDTIQQIRGFNRFYTDILGLLNRHILDSPYSLTEVRVLFEIDKIKDCTANRLMEKLHADRGYMSRILKRFETNGLIYKMNSTVDGRTVFLYLTPQGKNTLTQLEEKSGEQVQMLIGHLTDSEKEEVVKSMKRIQAALIEGVYPVMIRTYRPEDLDYIITRHREVYGAEYGFNSVFGDYVEEYVRKFNECHDSTKENIWVAEEKGKPVGVIALVRVDDNTAQLRWFLVEPEMRGRGLGHRLMRTAIGFCKEKGYKHVYLLTVDILETARHLYRHYGFNLTHTEANASWGRKLYEERWDMFL